MNKIQTVMYHVLLISRILALAFLLIKIYTAIYTETPLARLLDVDLWILVLLIDWYIRHLIEEVQKQN